MCVIFKKDFDIRNIVNLILDNISCYEILGLKPGASMQEIKDAYRSLALKHHPDKDSSEGNAIRFMQICDAYQTLRIQQIKELNVGQKFSDIYPEDAVEYFKQAESKILQQKHEEAIEFLDKSLEKLPRYTNAWLKKGDILLLLKRYEDALYCYGKVLQINPESVDGWNLQGICLSELKRYESALESFDEVILLDPTHAAAWNFKGVSYFILGRLGQALECFDRATKLYPEFGVAWYNKGRVLLKLDKKKESDKCFEKANKLR